MWPSALFTTLTKNTTLTLCCFCKPHLNIWHTQRGGDGRRSMKWRNITDVSLHELLPLCSLPAQSGLFSLSFFSSCALHQRQMTSPNLISVAACKGLPRRLQVNRAQVDTVQIRAKNRMLTGWILTDKLLFLKKKIFHVNDLDFLTLACIFVFVCTCLFMHEKALFTTCCRGQLSVWRVQWKQQG